MLGEVIQHWRILNALFMPETKGKVKAKIDTTGTAPNHSAQDSQGKSDLHCCWSHTWNFTHKREPKTIWESQKTNHTRQLEFQDLVTRGQSGNIIKVVLKIILKGTKSWFKKRTRCYEKNQADLKEREKKIISAI